MVNGVGLIDFLFSDAVKQHSHLLEILDTTLQSHIEL